MVELKYLLIAEEQAEPPEEVIGSRLAQEQAEPPDEVVISIVGL